MKKVVLVVATLVACVCAPVRAQVYLAEDFNDNTAGWYVGPTWSIGPATASVGCVTNGGMGQDPSADADGIPGGGIAGVNIGGCTNSVIQPYQYLVSPPVDTTGATGLVVEFDRWLNADYDPYMHSRVDVWDGTQWVNLFLTGTSVTTASVWTHFSYGITAYSNPALRVRFGYDVTSTLVYNVSGWNVDNVRISNREFFRERFVSNAAGWTLGTEWAVGPATAGGTGACPAGTGDPSVDADGTPSGGIAGAALGGNIGIVVTPYRWITSPVINASAARELRLSFDRWLNADYPPYVDHRVEVLASNGTWHPLFQTLPALCMTASSWTNLTYDISAYRSSFVRIRFGHSILQAGAIAASGWNVDNISVYDPAPCSLDLFAYNGSGSIRITGHCLSPSIPPGTTLFNCFTLISAGYPTGWFFGISPDFISEVLWQWSTQAPPFVGVTDAAGDVVWQLPVGVPPGLLVHGVTVAMDASGSVLGSSIPVQYVTW